MNEPKKLTMRRIISFLKGLDEAQLREVERIITMYIASRYKR